MQHDGRMLASQQRVTVVFDRHRLVGPTQLHEKVGNGCPVIQRDGLVVGDDRDTQGFAAAAILAAAFFSAL